MRKCFFLAAFVEFVISPNFIKFAIFLYLKIQVYTLYMFEFICLYFF